MNENLNTIGQRVRNRRLQLNYLPDNAADMARMNREQYRKLELCQYIPTPDQIYQLHEALGISTTSLLNLTGDIETTIRDAEIDAKYGSDPKKRREARRQVIIYITPYLSDALKQNADDVKLKQYCCDLIETLSSENLKAAKTYLTQLFQKQ